MDSTERNDNGKEVGAGSVSRLFALLRTLGEVPEGGERVTQLAQQVGLSQPTTHRLLRSLMDEGMVEQDARSKRYRLSLEFFALAANAGKTGNLRDLQRLAALCMAWFEPGNEAHWLDKALQQWSGAAHDSSTAELISMGSREEQTKYFHAELALRTKATEGSWKAAAKALDCSVKTLQRDAEGY